MVEYITRRILLMIPTLLLISVLVFVMIQLPPGDIVTSQIAQLQEQGIDVSEEQIEALRALYNLNDPLPIRYLRWMGGLMRGDLGYSLLYQQPVNNLIWDRLGYTVVIAVASLLLTWTIAFPLGIVSALRQHTAVDYGATLIAFVGLSIPNFMLALILMYLGYEWFGVAIGGLFSPEYAGAPWSFDKAIDLLRHLWIPAVVIGTAGTAGLMRILRANLLDELCKPYVVAARARGVGPVKLVIKYPLRIAINPFISEVGWILPMLISGEAITAIVLNLPTTGPILLESLMNQDMYLAGSFLLMLSVLTVIGTLISDILLAITDPRIRYGKS
jgi:peptide/nickel transport system permease protein